MIMVDRHSSTIAFGSGHSFLTLVMTMARMTTTLKTNVEMITVRKRIPKLLLLFSPVWFLTQVFTFQVCTVQIPMSTKRTLVVAAAEPPPALYLDMYCYFTGVNV